MKCRHLFTLFALAVTMGAAHAEPADDAKVLSAMEQAWATASQTADQPVLNAIGRLIQSETPRWAITHQGAVAPGAAAAGRVPARTAAYG